MSRKLKELLSEIERTEFHRVSGDGWDVVFDKLLELVEADSPEIVDRALERAATAIWSEKFGPDYDPDIERDTARPRLKAVLARLSRRADVVARVVDFASYAGSMAIDDAFRTEFLEWVDGFQPPPEIANAWAEAALVIRVRLYSFGDTWETAAPHLIGLLDHVSLHVRACAAEALGGLTPEKEAKTAAFAEAMQLIHDKEIERPGIAGPFYETLGLDLRQPSGGRDAPVKAWMLSIIENRKAPEPPLLQFHFNGIDFHAHELFAGDPDGVRELLRIGRVDIAVAAATDEPDVIEGMEEILIELGISEDEMVCRSVSWHLAYYYRTLHPHGEELGYVSRLSLSGGEELFLNGYPDNPRASYAAILYPPMGRPFTSDEARVWIDRLLPADMRGAAAPFFPIGWPGETIDGGHVSRDKVNYRWACGAVGWLKGDVPARQWESLCIIWRGEENVWTPGVYVSGESPTET